MSEHTRTPIDEPLVTVAVPMYNAESFVARTIRSILKQSHSNLQIFVYDNSSTDRSREIVSSFDDPRVSLITSKRNYGPGFNWNRCLQRIDGKYFKLVCADDILYPTCIEEQVQVFESRPDQNIALVACSRDMIDENDRAIMRRGYPTSTAIVPGKKAIKMMVQRGTNKIGEPMAGLVRSDIAKSVGPFRDRIPYVIDVDFWIRALRMGDLYIMNKSLCAFRLSSQSWSARIGLLQFSQYARFIEQVKKENSEFVSVFDGVIGKTAALANCIGRMAFFKIYTSPNGSSRSAAT